jgi:glycosyltransferase involved in cell wall biosynthesis
MIDNLIEHDHEVLFLANKLGPPHSRHSSFTPLIINTKELPWLIRVCVDKLLKLIRVSQRSNFYSVPSYAQIKQILTQTRPDIVVVRDVTQTLSLYTLFACKLHGLKTVLYNQYPLEDKQKYHIRFFQTLGIVPRHRITPIHRNKELTHYGKTNSYYVPLTTTQKYDIKNKTYVQNNCLRFLFVGKLTLQRKNHLLALRAFHHSTNQLPTQLTIIGGFNPLDTRIYDEIIAYIKKHDLASKVTVKTTVPHEEMSAEYAAHDVFLFPSVDEPFSISTIEAMAHGCVPIVTDTNGTQFCITNEKTGFIVPSNDEVALVERLSLLNENVIRQVGTNAHTYITENLNNTRQYQLLNEALLLE